MGLELETSWTIFPSKAQIGPNYPNSTEFGANSTDFMVFGRNFSIFAYFVLFHLTWPIIASILQTWPNLVKFGPNFIKFLHFWEISRISQVFQIHLFILHMGPILAHSLSLLSLMRKGPFTFTPHFTSVRPVQGWALHRASLQLGGHFPPAARPRHHIQVAP
jgi:hypothetical protein